MSSIRILPSQVANQIAAGEVIERPAAVVKELLENSLDAGAKRVEVEFRHGGRSYMRVEDTGRGMGRDDALLSLERHATSKIRAASDLDLIASFGFRGEALPSIASVSRFLLRTRSDRESSGTEILVNSGKIQHVRDCGMPPGTRIEVSHLFNSVPARRKFLKTDATEAGHIINCVRLYALAHPEKAFTLIDNGRVLFQSPPCEALKDRIGEIYGRKLLDDLLEIDETSDGLRLRGLIGKPGLGRSTRHETVTFVNRRPVDSRTLVYALLESYHATLGKGRHPVVFLFLDMDSRGVDVNVHPAKREIRFREEGRVRRFVVQAVLRRLQEAGGELTMPQSAPGAREVSGFSAPVARGTPPEAGEGRGTDPSMARAPADRDNARPQPRSKSARAGEGEGSDGITEDKTAAAPLFDWRFLGVVRGRLALFESEDGLVLVDRRAAHERVMYEEILRRYEKEEVASQRLLFPVPLEVDAIAAGLLEEHRDFLCASGFEVAPFGRNFFRVETAPNWIEPEAVEGFLRDLIGLMKEDNLPTSRPALAREQFARLAATRALRLGDQTGEQELRSLVLRLLACDQPLTNPQGRPTLIEIDQGELDKRFQRR